MLSQAQSTYGHDAAEQPHGVWTFKVSKTFTVSKFPERNTHQVPSTHTLCFMQSAKDDQQIPKSDTETGCNPGLRRLAFH